MLVMETGYVKATEVEGDSKEVGAKVMYQGREMIVSKGVDRNGDLFIFDPSGAAALAARDAAPRVPAGAFAAGDVTSGHAL